MRGVLKKRLRTSALELILAWSWWKGNTLIALSHQVWSHFKYVRTVWLTKQKVETQYIFGSVTNSACFCITLSNFLLELRTWSRLVWGSLEQRFSNLGTWEISRGVPYFINLIFTCHKNISQLTKGVRELLLFGLGVRKQKKFGNHWIR